MAVSQLVEAKHCFIKRWRPDHSLHLTEKFERELDNLLHLAAREAVAPVVKQYTELLLANVRLDLRPTPVQLIKANETRPKPSPGKQSRATE